MIPILHKETNNLTVWNQLTEQQHNEWEQMFLLDITLWKMKAHLPLQMEALSLLHLLQNIWMLPTRNTIYMIKREIKNNLFTYFLQWVAKALMLAFTKVTTSNIRFLNGSWAILFRHLISQHFFLSSRGIRINEILWTLISGSSLPLLLIALLSSTSIWCRLPLQITDINTEMRQRLIRSVNEMGH